MIPKRHEYFIGGPAVAESEKEKKEKIEKPKTPTVNISLEKNVNQLSAELSRKLNYKVQVVDVLREEIENRYSEFTGHEWDTDISNKFAIEANFNSLYKKDGMNLCFIHDPHFTVGVVYKKL